MSSADAKATQRHLDSAVTIKLMQVPILSYNPSTLLLLLRSPTAPRASNFKYTNTSIHTDSMSRNICISAADGHTGHLIAELILTNNDFKSKVDSVSVLSLHPTTTRVKELGKLGT